MEQNRQTALRRFFAIRGMASAMIALAALFVIYVGFGLKEPTVFSATNNMNLLRSMSKYLLIGIGQSYLLITGNIDLSIGAMVGMSAMISATLMIHAVHPVWAALVTLACCLVIGLVNGFLVGKCKLPPFIATLGTMFCARGIAYMVNNNRNTDAISSGIGKPVSKAFENLFYYGKVIDHPWWPYNTFWIALLLFALFFFLLSKTRTGRHIYAIGSNVEAAKLSGVNVFVTTTKAYLVSAFCAFMVGLILCAQAGMGNMEAGNTYEMYGVAAGVIGGISPLGGTGLLLGTFMGAAVWQALENGLNMSGAQVGIQRIAIGVIVVFSVLLDVVVRRGALEKRRISPRKRDQDVAL
ncbi:MAG: ABC transporter permease [Candidatus Limiplasma sp.]|nr:ABC transporter permease [Candidatus Limiplasma sp.]